MRLSTLTQDLARRPLDRCYGRVAAVQGLLVEVAGLDASAGVGSRLNVLARDGTSVPVEVVGFRANRAMCLPYGDLTAIGIGCKAYLEGAETEVAPSAAWLGRVVDGLGRPMDGLGRLPQGDQRRSVRARPPAAHTRARVGEKLDTGIKALNIFTPFCSGQRMGLFAGSGVGKSVLLSMMARYTACDVAVIGLIGERGREVQEFIQDDLGALGLQRSVVVVATSDQPALMRRQAAYLTLAVAEQFRDQGLQVLCLMDSVTRFAMAQREIGLACGEPPTTKGYTPTVFAELPLLLERAGPGVKESGAITGVFTVLVDGDDHNEPVADAVRGILDGHVVMERAIAERGRYPAINVLKSISRTLPRAHSDDENLILGEARKQMALFSDIEDMVRLGAYRRIKSQR
jgi:flagellum-specific ATP synthase